MSNKDELTNEFMSYRRLLMKFVSKIVPPKDVEDVVQEAYVRACQVEHQINQPRSFLLKTAKNLALDYVKRAEYRLAVSIEDDAASGVFEDQTSGDETYKKAAANQEFSNFCEAVRVLPIQCRRAFVLKKVYGYSQREIAEYMEISESTVEKHVANGIRRCMQHMKRKDIEKFEVNNVSKMGVVNE